MLSVRRAAERSLLAIGDEEASELRAFEIKSANPVKRAGLSAIDSMARCRPGGMATVLRVNRQAPDIEVLGDGWVSTVYLIDESTVLKVIESSIDMPRRERRKAAARMKDDHQALIDYVGEAVVPHNVEIGAHPLERASRAIRIVQPYCELDFLKLNEEGPQAISRLTDRLTAAERRYPKVLEEIRCMTIGSRALFEERQLANDIIGRNNMGVVVDTGRFAVIDAQPVTCSSPEGQSRINRCFDNLELALAAA